MPRAILTTYHGERMSLGQIKRRLGICDKVLQRWRRNGRLNEAVIDWYLHERSIQREARAKARAAGISDGTRRMRLCRGWPPDRVAEPLLSHAEACMVGNARRFGGADRSLLTIGGE